LNHKVILHRPEWVNNTIRFTWTSKELDFLFLDNLNYIEIEYFEDFNFDLRIAYNQMMCLLFPILNEYVPGHVEVHFEDTLVSSDVEQWIKLRDLSSIVVMTDLALGSGNTQIQPIESTTRTETGDISLLYGGGKDSLAALSIFSRIYPKEEIHILRVHWSRQSPTKHRNIFSEQVIQPLSKIFNVNYVECTSSLHRNLKKRKTAHAIGIHFYHGCLLQLYNKYQYRIVNYSYDAMEYFTSPKIGYPSIRPEKAAQTSKLFQNLSIDTNVRNISFGIPSFLHFDIIKSDHRNLISLTYMCEDTKQKWCYNCRKCFTFGLFGLENAYNSSAIDFSYEKLFSEGGYFTQKIQPLLQTNAQLDGRGLDTTPKKNLYDPLLAYKAQFASFRHSLAQIDRSKLLNLEILSLENIEKIDLLCLIYSQINLETRQLWVKALQFEAKQDAPQMLDFFTSIGIELNHEESITVVNDRSYKYSFSNLGGKFES
jgi:hypothetical protein